MDAPVLRTVADELATRISICKIPDPRVPSSAFTIFNSERNEHDDYWVRYECKETCSQWQQCQAPAYLNDNGELITHGRKPDIPKKALAFVVGGMGGQLVFSEDGDKTVVIHAGSGGTRFYVDVARVLEERSSARTAMVRWEKGVIGSAVQPPFAGPVHWGWYSRTAAEGTTVRALNSRPASIIAWVHEHLAGDAEFGTWGCSMGTNATFGPVLWHGLDPIIDYQLFVGGPNMWDLNAQCGRRRYTEGYCDLDGTTSCKNDGDCALLGAGAHCRMPRPYREIDKVFDGFANHVHATTACQIAQADETTQPYPAFDQSSMAYIESADWEIDHRVDFLVNLGRLSKAPRRHSWVAIDTGRSAISHLSSTTSSPPRTNSGTRIRTATTVMG